MRHLFVASGFNIDDGSLERPDRGRRGSSVEDCSLIRPIVGFPSSYLFYNNDRTLSYSHIKYKLPVLFSETQNPTSSSPGWDTIV